MNRDSILPQQDVSSALGSFGIPESALHTKDVRKAAQNFEAFFVGYIFQTAYEAIPKSELTEEGGMGNEMYHSLFIQETVSKIINSGHGFGLANQLAGKLPNATDVAAPGQAPQSKQAFELPVARVSSDYGMRVHPISGEQKFHKGVDLAFPMGSPIKSAADGTVIFSGEKGGYGKAIIVKHADGYTTLYAHNSDNLVQVGDRVTRGQVIGTTGHSGYSTGPHLHFELQRSGRAVDPEKYVVFEENI